ncbi:DgyrCDS2291 [Dimorphilus gyrociliatus]|uniref:Tripeptidyl-peptidase 2 n=1 Tax=Dimorphilus gyrociliatus TaxID=2664684 RepID=A0A7I8VA12_9ANNE|nr:DgyrCDS2291 [Dimorphilus gyrociliatus]
MSDTSTHKSFDSDFPILGLLPKKETGAWQFLNKYPEYDGKNVTIGILDSGVDPGAAGLQKTPDGRPKIIDIVDATGSGDVDVSTTVEAVDGTITGLSGRKLKIPTFWTNPSNVYHIGIKSSLDLYPKLLRERLSTEYKKKIWDPQHREKLAEAVKKLEDFDREPSVELSQEEREIREDLQHQIDVLNSTEKKYNFPPKIFDCVVFNDGKVWRACMDTSCIGKLEDCSLMASYYEENQYATISALDQMNYSFNIWNDGNVLEVVTNAGSHGTHVACIAAGYFEHEPEKNGIAPGAQIVAIKIGDSRLGSMETGTALIRAIIHLSRKGVKLANYSYGEGYLWPNAGRINEVIEESVRENGLVFVSSAGNDGPALGTVGSPGGTCSSIVSVGAYVTPEMMKAEYSLREYLPLMHYTWSSRGPAADGALGISISAPGGAITSVANWTLKGSELMNGTSMSSPNACGCIALIMSALAAKGRHCSPYELRRALEYCAINESSQNFDKFAAGFGVVKVEKTFDYLHNVLSHRDILMDINWHVSVTMPKSGSNSPGRGIFIHEPNQAFKRTEHFVYVKPELHGEGLEKEKINLSVHARLVCEESYVKSPSHIELMNTGRGFYIQVDPTGLETGCYLTELKAFDCDNVERGPLWRLPITVIVPRKVPSWNYSQENISFQPGEIRRHFFVVPIGASYVEVKISSNHKENSLKMLLHAVQFHSFSTKRLSHFLSLNPLATADDNFILINDNSTIEITIARWWASLGNATLSYSVQFRGVMLSSKSFTLHAGAPALPIDIKSYCPRAEEISPNVTLRFWEQSLKPSSFKIRTLDSIRDCVVPYKRQIYGLELIYKLNIDRTTDVVINFAPLSSLLYESDLESQLWMLHDAATKVHITSGDAFPSGYSKKLDKGDYLLRLQIRHEKQDILEKLKDLTATIQLKLHSNITLDLYSDTSGALVNSRKFPSSIILPEGESSTFFAAPPNDEKISKNSGRLLGSLTLSRDESIKKAVNYPFYYVIPNGKKNNKSTPEKRLSNEEASKILMEAERDCRIAHLRKLEDPLLYYNELCIKYNDYVPLHLSYLQGVEANPNVSSGHITDVCTKALDLIDKNEVLINIGLKNDQRPDAARIKADTETKKLWLIELYIKFSSSLLDSLEKVDNDILRIENQNSIELMKSQLHQSILNLMSLSDSSQDQQTGQVIARYASYKRLYGKSLKILLKIFEERCAGQDSNDLEVKIISLCKKCDWNHLANYYEDWRVYKHPKGPYRPF